MEEWRGSAQSSRGWPRWWSGGKWGSMQPSRRLAAEDEPGAGQPQGVGGQRHVPMSLGVNSAHYTLLQPVL